MQSFRRVHFIGIGGVGMSGIAEVLHNAGLRRVRVRSCGVAGHAQRLAKLGIDVRDRP